MNVFTSINITNKPDITAGPRKSTHRESAVIWQFTSMVDLSEWNTTSAIPALYQGTSDPRCVLVWNFSVLSLDLNW